MVDSENIEESAEAAAPSTNTAEIHDIKGIRARPPFFRFGHVIAIGRKENRYSSPKLWNAIGRA
jgi:hypothetical protein